MSNPEVNAPSKHEILPGSSTHIVATMGIPTGFMTAFLISENASSEQSLDSAVAIQDQSSLVDSFGSTDILVASVGAGLVACTAIAVAIERCKRRGESFTGLHREKN